MKPQTLTTIKVLRGLAVATMVIGYALLVHHVNTTKQTGFLGASLALAPLLLLILAYAVKTGHKVLSALLLLGVSLIAWLLLPMIQARTAWLFWLQDVGLMLALLLSFARTLQPGRKPLCVHFAEIIHGGTLPARHAHYARRVTIVWVIFFASMTILSSVLFFLAPLATWSIFVNFLTLPLVACLFIAEFIVRRLVLTDLPAGNLLDAVRAYRDHAKRV